MLVLCLGALAAPLAGAAASDRPRVVSINVCTDQLLLQLAAPEQILSLSVLASDPRSSSMAEAARSYPRNAAGAEEVAVLAPDLVVAGAYNDPATLAMLDRLGIPVARFPIVTDLSQIPVQIRQMGTLLQQEARAEALASRVEAVLAALPAPAPDAPLAAFFYPNGYALGANTLGHDIVTAAGARNLSVELGLSGGGRVSLEETLLARPDLLIGARPYDGHSRSEEMMAHPALAGFSRIQSSPDWVCGGPQALDAVAQVRAALKALP